MLFFKTLSNIMLDLIRSLSFGTALLPLPVAGDFKLPVIRDLEQGYA